MKRQDQYGIVRFRPKYPASNMRPSAKLTLNLFPVLLASLLIPATAFAQAEKPPAPGSNASVAEQKPVTRRGGAGFSDDSQEAIVVEQFTSHASFNADGTGTREVTAVVRVQAEAGVQNFGVLTFTYTASSQTVEVDYVRVRRPDGTVVITPEYNIQDMPSQVTREAPMYSDIHEKHVAVKGLGVGDVLEYKVRFNLVKAEVPGQFWFDYNFTRDAVVKNEELVLTLPRDKYVKISSPDYKPVRTENGANQVYTWRTSNPQRQKPDMPRRFVPAPSVQVTTFQSWDEIARWYNGLQQTQLTVTPEIRSKAAELTKGLTSDDEKLRAIYKFVSTRIHYISLSFGIGRYKPHAAEDVLGNEYGDCKDKHTLLASLLKAAGYEAWPALININRKFSPDVPSPSQFDHVITVVPRSGSFIWLDSTPEVAPFGLLLGPLRDKETLVIPAQAAGSIMRTPPNPPMRTAFLFQMKGKLDDDGTFIGHANVSARGDVEVLYRAAFRKVSPAQWKELAQNIIRGQGFGGEVSDVSATAPDDIDKPFQFAYTYTRKDYAEWPTSRHTLAALPYTTLFAAPDDAKEPADPVFLGAPGELVFRSEMELPRTFRPKLPVAVNLVNDFLEYHMTYAFANGVFTAERRLVIKQQDLPLSEWAKYKKFNKDVNDDQGRYIDEDTADSAQATPTGNAEADRNFQQALEAFNHHDYSGARDALRRTLEIDPKYPRAHASIGGTYFMQKNVEKGIEEFEKEEELNPEFSPAYRSLANVFTLNHRTAEAIEQWRKLLKVHPDDVDAAVNLGDMLRGEKKYQEAVDAMEPTFKIKPDDVYLQFALGSAYLGTAQPDKGIKLLEAVGNGDDDEMRAAVAGNLAEHNLALDKAQGFAERAIRALEGSSAKLQHPSEKGYELTRALSDAWGTLGRVYYRKGEFDKALPYSRAAWELSQSAIHGMHLAQVYEAQGKKSEAAHIYKLAQTCQGADRELIRQQYEKLTGQKLEEWPNFHLHRGPRESMSPEEELSRARDVTITMKPHVTGSAVFAVALSPGKVDEAVWISGDTRLKALSPQITSAKFNVEFPDAGPVKLARRGILMCGNTGCQFTMLLPDSVHAADQ